MRMETEIGNILNLACWRAGGQAGWALQRHIVRGGSNMRSTHVSILLRVHVSAHTRVQVSTGCADSTAHAVGTLERPMASSCRSCQASPLLWWGAHAAFQMEVTDASAYESHPRTIPPSVVRRLPYAAVPQGMAPHACLVGGAHRSARYPHMPVALPPLSFAAAAPGLACL